MFEAEPDAYGFRQVGYIAAVPEAQVADLRAIREQHDQASYESELVVGSADCREYLAFTWPDWEAPVEGALHEPRGGWADAMQTVRQLAARAGGAGATITEGVEVTGFELGAGGVRAVYTSAGRIGCETVIIAPGPWAARLWGMLGQAPEVELCWTEPEAAAERLLEGAGGRVPAPRRRARRPRRPRAAGGPPRPARPLLSDRDGRVIADRAWGIYFRFGRTGTAVTGGGLPVLV